MTEVAMGREVVGMKSGAAAERDAAEGTTRAARRVSAVVEELTSSMILTIAAEVRALIASGTPVCNLTVGDFSPSEFSIPSSLLEGIVTALRAGQTNYPPSDGMERLRDAVRDFYRRRLGLDYPRASVLVTAGARPAIYAAYRALVDPGDHVVYPVPSWNNNYYCHLVGARDVTVPCGPETRFHPTAAALRDALRGARMLVLNSPLNPTGTMLDAATLGAICDLILEENARRERTGGERPLFLLYDQVYWMLTFGTEHVNPVSVRPAMQPYTVMVDAISKSFAATGLRVGWTVGPADIIKRMSDVTTHVGAWAPKPEQLATASLIADDRTMDEYHAGMRKEVEARLSALASGIAALKRDGFPVDSSAPQGAMYLSARFALSGRRTPKGEVLRTNEDIRRYLLNSAGLAAVQFQAFDAPGDTGWFRLSAGAVSLADINALIPRVREALETVRS